MDNMKYYDVDGFELEFESGTTLEERIYFAQEYRNVMLVADKRNHCTSCNVHIGTPPSAEDCIRMHTVLRVTQCVKCYKFYNNGEFDRDEDGSELYCRWCGQGGELLCCSQCPYVFCQKCVLRNFSYDGLKEILSIDNWKCYACTPKMLYPLRAQHWALVNFIKKQKKALDSKMAKGLSDQDEIAYNMKKDASTCCPSKTTVLRRLRKISTDAEDDSWSEPSDGESTNRSKKKFKSNKTPKAVSRKDINPETHSSSVPDTRNKAKLYQNGKSRPSSTATTVTANSSTAMQQLSMAVPVSARMTAPVSAEHQQATYRNNISLTNGIHRPTEPFYLNSNVSSARSQLESEMLNAMEVCRQVDGKVKTLMNSLPYRTANKMSDIKELYIHFSYLLRHTNDRVQSLQDKCLNDMRQFGFANDVEILSRSNDTSRSDIVEHSNAIITLDDSDDSDDEQSHDVAENTFTMENLECQVDVAAMLQLDYDEDDSDDIEVLSMPGPLENVHNAIVSDDKKLKSKVKIVSRRAENEFPDLMKIALLDIMNRLIEDNNRRKRIENIKLEIDDDEQGGKTEIEKINVSMESSDDDSECHNLS